MASVPVFRREGHDEGSEILPWNDEPLFQGSNLWDSFFGRGSPFGRFMRPSEVYTPSSFFSKDAEAMAKTHIEWWESADAHIMEADLPGVSKDDVEILVENGRVLQISARSKKRSGATYLKRLRLPAYADAPHLKAELENGLLTVTIPKLSSTASSSQVRVVEVEE